jgi:hypothetical protein
MFGVADALVIRPLAVDRPEQLRAVYTSVEFGGRREKAGTLVGYTAFTGLRRNSNAFAAMMAFRTRDTLV